MKRKILSFLLSFTILISQMSVFAESKNNNGRNIAEYFNIDKILQSVEITVRENNQIIELKDGDDFNENMEMHLKFLWDLGQANLPRLEDELQAHDYFEFSLPDNVKIREKQEYFIRDENGGEEILVEAHVDGSIRLEFLKDGSDYDPIPFKGDIDVTAMLDTDKTPEGGSIELVFPIEDQDIFHLHLVPEGAHKHPYKQFSHEFSDDVNNSPKKVSWEIIFNEDYRDLKNIVVKENMEGILKLESFEVYKKENGEWKTYNVYKQKGEELYFDAVSEPIKVIVHSRVDESQLSVTQNDYTVKNKASIVWDGMEERDLEASVNLSYDSIAEKKAGTFDRTDRSITWTVDLNKRSVKLEQARFVDEFDVKVFEYLPETLTITNQKTKEKLVEGQDYKIIWSEQSFELEFLKDIEDHHQMVYKTKVKDKHLINENVQIKNTISLQGEGGSNTVGVGSQNIGKGILDKYTNENWINFDERTVSWQVDINRYKRNLKNIVLEDTWEKGTMKLREDSVRVLKDGKEMDKEDYDFTVFDNGFKFQTKTKDEDNSHYVLSFKTEYDARNIQSKKDVELLNHAHLSLDYQGKKWTGNAYASAKIPAQKAQNGFKQGHYNAESKEITWDIYSNYHEFELENAYLEDTIAKNQKLIQDSVQIFEYSVAANGQVKLEKEVTEELEDYLKVEDRFIRFDFPKGHQRYLIRFKTSVITDNEETVLVEKEYHNSASVHYSEDESYEYDAKVQPPHDSFFIKKHGQYLEKNSNEILWTLIFNESQSLIKDAVITDKPDANQIVDYESLEITVLKMQANGRYEDSDQKLSLHKDYEIVKKQGEAGQEYFEIQFLKTVDQALKIQYKSEVSADQDKITGSKVQIHNEVFIKGLESQTEDWKTEGSLSIFVQDLSANAYGLKGKVKIKKVGQRTNQALEGVQFALYTDKGRLVAEGETDENGEWLVDRNIINRTYILKEIATKDGYLLPENDLEIEVKFEDDQNLHIEKITNEENHVRIRKINENGKALSGAKFKLEGPEGSPMLSEDALTTDKKGYLHLYGLVDGDYRLTEIASPEGYMLNTEAITFKVENNLIKWNDTYHRKLDLDFTNYQGRVELVKTGHDEKPLKGVKYGLFEAKSQKLLSEHVSDQDGKVSIQGIVPGAYYLQELESSEGHLVNLKKHFFTVEKSANGDPGLISLNDQNQRASVIFRKVDGKNEAQFLQNARFNLYRQGEEEAIAQSIGSNEEGLFIIENLSPGTYHLEEVQAHDDYLLNTEGLDFIIPNSIKEDQTTLFDLGTFKNYQQDLEMRKVNDQGKALAGVRFELYDSEDQLLMELESNEEGLVRIENLAPGQYSLKEIESVDAYLIDPKPIDFEVAKEAKGEPETIMLDDHINKKARIEVLKVDESGQALEGVEFTLYRKEGEKVQTVLSDEQGLAVFEDVGYGDYLLRETNSLKDYLLNEETIEISIDPIAHKDNTYRYEMINYQAEVILSKTDTNNQPLEGVNFDLYYEDALYLEGLESDEAGQIHLENLAPGAYYFIETSSVDGRLVDPRPIAFTVSEKAWGKPEVIEIDAYQNHYASASLLKTDALGRLVEASFALDILEDGAWKDLGLEVHTQNGHLLIQNLAVGSYRLREVASDAKHLINTEEVFFEIPEGHEDFYHLELDDFINYQASLSIYKVDEENRVLEGAEFVLEHMESGQRYQALVKGNQHLFTALVPGEYRIIELHAPEGYHALEKELRWTIPASYEGEYQYAINISNQAIVDVEEVDSTFITPEEVEEVMEASILPQTGQTALKLYLSLSLMLLGFVLYYRPSKK